MIYSVVKLSDIFFKDLIQELQKGSQGITGKHRD